MIFSELNDSKKLSAFKILTKYAYLVEASQGVDGRFYAYLVEARQGVDGRLHLALTASLAFAYGDVFLALSHQTPAIVPLLCQIEIKSYYTQREGRGGKSKKVRSNRNSDARRSCSHRSIMGSTPQEGLKLVISSHDLNGGSYGRKNEVGKGKSCMA